MSTTELKSKALTGELPPVLPPPEHTTNFVDSDSLVVAVDVSDGEARFQKRAKELEVKKSEHHSQSALMDMPLDIIFEIFTLLTAKDLLNLTRTNTALRATLASAGAKAAWKAGNAFLGLPRCPRDIPEASWANLFLSTRCQECGAQDVDDIQGIFRRRVCNPCKEKHMVSTCSFEKVFPGIDPIVMELLPWAKYKPKMFWDSDLLKMSKRLGVYQRAVNECNPDAGPAMENFKKNCMEEAEWIMDAHYMMDCDATEASYQYRRELVCVYDMCFQRFQSLLLELGHRKDDIQEIKYLEETKFHIYNFPLVTDAVWEHLRPTLEAAVVQQKQSRKRRARQTTVEELYTAYGNRSTYFERKNLPAVGQIKDFDEIASLLNDEFPDYSISDNRWAEMVEAWRLKWEVRLFDWHHLDPPKPGYPGSHLDLAISVFRCQFCTQSLYGKDRLLSHKCIKGDDAVNYAVLYFEPMSAMAAILDMLGLDRNTTTFSDLNRIDPFFICATCPADEEGDVRVYSWYECFFFDCSRQPEVRWIRVKPKQEEYIREHDLHSGNIQWDCAHCDEEGTKNDMILHVEEDHCILDPVPDRDITYWGTALVHWVRLKAIITDGYEVSFEDVTICRRERRPISYEVLERRPRHDR